MCGVSLTHLILFYVETFSYTPLTDLCGDFSLTCPFLFYVGSFSYTPLCCFIWGVPLTCPILFYVGSFFYMAHAVLCGEFLLHTPCCFIGGGGGGGSLTLLVLIFMHEVCFPCPLLFRIRNFSPGISLPHPMQVYVGRFSNSMPCLLSCEDFHLYFPFCFMWEISHNFTCLVLVYLGT